MSAFGNYKNTRGSRIAMDVECRDAFWKDSTGLVDNDFFEFRITGPVRANQNQKLLRVFSFAATGDYEIFDLVCVQIGHSHEHGFGMAVYRFSLPWLVMFVRSWIDIPAGLDPAVGHNKIGISIFVDVCHDAIHWPTILSDHKSFPVRRVVFTGCRLLVPFLGANDQIVESIAVNVCDRRHTTFVVE